MESSPSQNSHKNGNDPQRQPPPEGEADSEESNPTDAMESVEGNKPIEEAETSEINTASTSEPLQRISIGELNVITSEKDIKRVTLPNFSTEGEGVSGEELSGEQLSRAKIERLRARALQRASNKAWKTSVKTFFENPKKLAVIFSYASSNQQRQPFRPQPRTRPPDPPHYYTSSIRQQNSRQDRNRQTQQNAQPQPSQSPSQPPPPSASPPQSPSPPQSQQPQSQQIRHYNVARYVPLSQLGMFPFLLTQPASWAYYPNKIPDHVPPTLAQLVDAEVLFVIQQLDVLELMTDIVEPNFYLILNRNGECVYYAYETSGIFAQGCGGHNRGFQLHIVDLYQNEVIFMNRLCGCTYLFCCYPAIEVYSPPTVPIGAVTKLCTGCSSSFVIIDTDENILFTIHGDRGCFVYADADITINAIDSNKTQVGFIRREFVINPISYISNVDYYGLSFPGNMDVKIKALFLGALFLIDFMYFEGDSGPCACCHL